MNISSSIVKKTARTALKGRYFSGVAAAAIYIFTFLICILTTELIGNLAGGVTAVLFLIIFCVCFLLPLTLGFVYWGVRVIFSGDCEPIMVFKYFSSRTDYIRALRFSVPITGNALFSGILLFLPAIFADIAASGKLFIFLGVQIPLWASSLWGVSAILKFLASICLIFVMLKFYLAPFLLSADEAMEPLEAMHMSKIITTRSKRDFIFLFFSFSGYILACFFMIPTIFILPYFTASYTVHCRFAIAAYNRNIDSISQNSIPSFDASISF